MKRIVILILLICISSIAYAELTGGGVGWFQLGIGVGISDDNEVNLEVDIKFPYVFLAFDYGLGISWVGIDYKRLLGNHYWSFINFELFWNILAITPIKSFVFGPFAYINYAPFTNTSDYNYNFKEYLLCYGIKFHYGLEYKIFNIECGGRIIDNKNNFYFNVGIDIAVTLLFIQAIIMGTR
jgi:hypothetical protein